MGQQAKETGKITKRVRNTFLNHTECTAIRDGSNIYRLHNPEDREGSWESINFKGVNQAKKESVRIQCEAAGMKPDDKGNFDNQEKYHALGRGAVQVLK